MSLTQAQIQTLANAIAAETDASVIQWRTPATRDDGSLRNWLNLPSTFIAWKSSVQTREVGIAVNYVSVEAMTDANRGRITTFYAMNPEKFSPARQDIRDYWANTFSGALGGQGQTTRDALLALWKRAATRYEKVFATGTGTDAAPGLLTLEGTVDLDDVSKALNLIGG